VALISWFFGKRKKGNLFIKDFLTKNLPDYSGDSRGDTKGFKILYDFCDSVVFSFFYPGEKKKDGRR